MITQRKIAGEKLEVGERFIADNFGASCGMNEIRGLFSTLCLIPENLSSFNKKNQTDLKFGTYQTSSMLKVFSKISERTVITISKLATIHSDNIPKIESSQYLNSFNIILGDTVLDRINFWNFRTLKPSWTEEQSVLLIQPSLIDNFEFINILREYLHKNNYVDKVALRSSSLKKEQLEYTKSILQRNDNMVHLFENYDSPIIPKKEDIEKSNPYKIKSSSIFKINEQVSDLQADEPEHFNYIPTRFSHIKTGQSAIDLRIERHNNLSQYTNVIDIWRIPRERSVTPCFTGNHLSKISKNYLLTIVPPRPPNFSSETENTYQKLKYQLVLPEDKGLFESLIRKELRGLLPEDDMRPKKQPFYKEIMLSDKGQNLSGVISMFDSLSEAHKYFTNKFFREILPEYYHRDTLTFKEIFGILPNSREYKNKVKNSLNLSDEICTNKYLEENFKDSFEYLVEKKVFYQMYQRRCDYCGHINSKTIDEIRKQNRCEICRTVFYAPIDLEWRYKLNRFVYKSLYERNGLTVLWALGILLNKNIENSFYFLPEVDLLYNENKKEEVDILCVSGGQFIVGEVKKSSIGFTKKEIEIKKFIEKINRLKPDIALLVFEQYFPPKNIEGLDKDKSLAKKHLKSVMNKIKESIPKYISVECIVAEENPDFNQHPVELPSGYSVRTNKILGLGSVPTIDTQILLKI